MMTAISRRDFVRLATGSAAALMGSAALSQTRARRNIPIGLQLWALGPDVKADLPGTFAAVKKNGFEAVEFAGYYGQDAKTLRSLLDAHGLRCCGTHLRLNVLIGDELPKTIEFNQALGNPNLVVASLGSETPKTLDGWSKMAATFSEIAQRAKPSNMRIGFHNHSEEFPPIDGQVPFEYFFNRASQDVLMQLDIGNCAAVGCDQVGLINKFPGRVGSLHVKDFEPGTANVRIGAGRMRWQEIFRAAENNPSVQWYIVEHGRGLEATAESLRDLQKLLAMRS